MTPGPAGLPVRAGPYLDRTAADQETTDFERASMLVWRPLLDNEVSR